MEIKDVKPINVYYKTFETTLVELSKYVKDTPAKMYDDLEKYGIEPTGDQIWIYKGGDGNPDTKFTLEIAIPVNKLATVDNMHFKQLEEFKCISTIHNGPWENLKDTYGNIMDELQRGGNQPGLECREIYINCDFDNQENNITEVQVGIN